MPLYQAIVMMKATASASEMTALFRESAKMILANGGIVRLCENCGLKRLPHRMRSRHIIGGSEFNYHYFGRLVTMYFDCTPSLLNKFTFTFKSNHDVLRVNTLKPRKPKMDLVNSHKKNNPWRPPATPVPAPTAPSIPTASL